MAFLQLFHRLFCTGSPPEKPDILFFGLGNKGERYYGTRHNVGFRVADALARQFEKKRSGCYAQAEFVQGTLFETRKNAAVVKPLTYMNRSGEAVKKYVSYCRCILSNLLVIVDDYNLPLGIIRARRNGSDGGHNGLKSVIGELGGEGFPRLRVGIGPLPQNKSSTDFVLGTFTDSEEKKLAEVLSHAVDACVFFAGHGIDETMNRFN